MMGHCLQCGEPISRADIYSDLQPGLLHTACLEAALASGRWQPWQLGMGIGKGTKPAKASSWSKDWQRKERAA